MPPKKVTEIRGKGFEISIKQNLQTNQCKPRIESGSLYSYKDFGICWIAVGPPSRGNLFAKGNADISAPKIL